MSVTWVKLNTGPNRHERRARATVAKHEHRHYRKFLANTFRGMREVVV